MKDVDRHALIITPKPVFFALLARISGDEFEVPDLAANDSRHVYLLPGGFVYHEEALEWLETNRQVFFEEELFRWYEDEEKFPQNISWSEFQDYFVFSVQSMITDTVPDEPIYYEDDPA